MATSKDGRIVETPTTCRPAQLGSFGEATLDRARSNRGGSGRSLQIATGTAWLYISQTAGILRK